MCTTEYEKRLTRVGRYNRKTERCSLRKKDHEDKYNTPSPTFAQFAVSSPLLLPLRPPPTTNLLFNTTTTAAATTAAATTATDDIDTDPDDLFWNELRARVKERSDNEKEVAAAAATLARSNWYTTPDHEFRGVCYVSPSVSFASVLMREFQVPPTDDAMYARKREALLLLDGDGGGRATECDLLPDDAPMCDVEEGEEEAEEEDYDIIAHSDMDGMGTAEA
jgi:hypothetical protein